MTGKNKQKVPLDGIFVELSLNDNISLADAINVLNQLREKGAKVRAYAQSVYSYQGGNHGSNPAETRPEDWDRDTVGCSVSCTEQHAHDGDTLICVATSDRYGYAVERQLNLIEFETGDEAFQALLKVKSMEDLLALSK